MKKELDMEVTQERAAYMKKLLAKLYAHQIDAEIKNIMVRPEKKGGTARAKEGVQEGELA